MGGAVLDHLGVVARDGGESGMARVDFEQLDGIFRSIGAKISLAYAANHLGGMLAQTGDLIAAEAYFHEAIDLARQTGERRIEAYSLLDWGATLAGRAFSMPPAATTAAACSMRPWMSSPRSAMCSAASWPR